MQRFADKCWCYRSWQGHRRHELCVHWCSQFVFIHLYVPSYGSICAHFNSRFPWQAQIHNRAMSSYSTLFGELSPARSFQSVLLHAIVCSSDILRAKYSQKPQLSCSHPMVCSHWCWVDTGTELTLHRTQISCSSPEQWSIFKMPHRTSIYNITCCNRIQHHILCNFCAQIKCTE